jgi:hypothetical protein
MKFVATPAAHEHAEMTQLRLRQSANMLAEFAAQMNLVAPRVHHPLELTGICEFTDLSIHDLFVEERFVKAQDLSPHSTGTIASINESSYEYLLFSWRYVGPHRHLITRQLAPEIERLESLLMNHRIAHEMKVQRNARAQVERVTFVIESSISAGVKFQPDYANGQIRIILRNVERLGETALTMDSANISQPLLDELAKCAIGMPNEFRRLAYGEANRNQPRLV